MMFAKFGKYFLFICRRERIVSLVWLLCLAGSAPIFAAFFPGLLPTEESVYQFMAAMENPAMIAMQGQPYGFDGPSQAIYMAQDCLIWYFIVAAIMNIFLINRHTRADEELGRLEMFRAMPVGRLAGGLAVVKFAFALNLLLSLFISASLLIVNIDGTTASGAFTYGFSIGAVGFLFAALTLLAAQLFSTARAVSGFGFAALIVFYMMRASGDVSGSAISYVSPLGLGLKIEAFYTNDALPIAVLLIEGAAFTAGALAINAVRDHGAGLIPARKGRAYASRFLQGPLGFAWRLTRGSVFAWGVGLLVIGATYGSVCADLESFVKDNSAMQEIILQSGGSSMLDSYVAMIFMIASIVVSVPIVLAAFKLHAEEKRGRLEQIFAKSVPRAKLYICFLVIAIFESVVFEILTAAGMAMAASEQLEFAELIKTGFAYLPAIWATAGLGVLLVGLLPKLTALIWTVFAYAFIASFFGELLGLPEWATKLTPFGNIPQLPAEEFSGAPLAVLTVVAIALGAVGVWRFKERDIG